MDFEKVTITSFRGLHDIELGACGAVNILVGGNNSGKTSVLEALLLLAAPTDVAQWDAAVALRRAWPLVDGLFPKSLSRLDAVTWLFPQRNGEQLPITLEAEGSGPAHRLVAQAERITGEPPERPVHSREEIVEAVFRSPSRYRSEGLELGLEPGLLIEMDLRWPDWPRQRTLFDLDSDSFRLTLWERGDANRPPGIRRAFVPHVAFATPISHRSDGYLESRVGKLIRDKKHGHAVELLQALDSGITDLVNVSPEEPENDSISFPRRRRPPTLHVEHATAGLVPVHAMGDGIRRAIHFAALLAELGKGGVLLIDEMESGMHTTVLRKAFSWLIAACKESKVQLFAATHSLETVDAVLQVAPHNEVVLYRLSDQGVRRYDGEMLRTARFELAQEVR